MMNFIVENRITQPKHIEALYSKLPEGARLAIDKRDAEIVSCSRSLVPVLRVAAAMKTGDDEQRVFGHDVKQRIREFPDARAAQAPERHRERKLKGVVGHAGHGAVNLKPEATTKPGGFRLIPILRV
jgi:hypothetical protein